MADIAASVPTDGDPDGAHSGTENTTGEPGPANPFDVDDEFPTESDIDPDGAFESELDPDGAIGDHMPLTSDDVDPDGVFGMGIEPDGMGDAVDGDVGGS